MSTIFSKIINNEIPSYKVAENEDFIAFLDIFPLAKGHTLIVSKKEVDYIFDMEDDLFIRINIVFLLYNIRCKTSIGIPVNKHPFCQYVILPYRS